MNNTQQEPNAGANGISPKQQSNQKRFVKAKTKLLALTKVEFDNQKKLEKLKNKRELLVADLTKLQTLHDELKNIETKERLSNHIFLIQNKHIKDVDNEILDCEALINITKAYIQFNEDNMKNFGQNAE
jgi:hypothetical protein